MKPETKARSILAAVIIATMILAVVSYLLPGTLAAYMFPGISKVNAGEHHKIRIHATQQVLKPQPAPHGAA